MISYYNLTFSFNVLSVVKENHAKLFTLSLISSSYCCILYCNLLYKMGKYFLERQYILILHTFDKSSMTLAITPFPSLRSSVTSTSFNHFMLLLFTM